VNEERLETTETIGNLFGEDRINERFSPPKLIPVKTTDRSHNGVNASLTEWTGPGKRVGVDLSKRVTKPLYEVNQIIEGDLLPVKMSLR
jgi:hypothetical protein